MHELSVAQSIVDIIGRYVEEPQRSAVRSVRVKVGAMSGIVPDSLEFCFSALTARTPLATAALSIDRVPFALRCPACRRTFESEAGTVVCPDCGGTEAKVISGTELSVTDIELADSEVAAT